MASVTNSTSATNIYNAISGGNKGIGGLASGLDTDSLVEALTLGTRNKISAQNQKKTLLQWQQTAYRGMATALRSFQAKYLDITNSTSSTIRMPSNYNVFKGTSTNSSVKVATSINSVPGSYAISVDKKATYASYTSNPKAATLEGSVIDPATTNFTGQTLNVTVDGATRTIALDSLNTINVSFEEDLEKLINEAFGFDYDPVGNPVNYRNDAKIKVEFTSDNTVSLSADTNKIVVNSASSALGLSSAQSNRLNTLSVKVADLLPGVVGSGADGNDLTFKINGTTFTAKLDENISSVVTRVNNADCGARLSYNATTGTFSLTATVAGGGDSLQMEDISGSFLNELFGAPGGGYLTTGNIGATTSATDALTAGSSLNRASIVSLVSSMDDGALTPTPGQILVTVNGIAHNLNVLLDNSVINDLIAYATNVDAKVPADYTQAQADELVAKRYKEALNSAINAELHASMEAKGQNPADVRFAVSSTGEFTLEIADDCLVRIEAPPSVTNDLFAQMDFDIALSGVQENYSATTFFNGLDSNISSFSFDISLNGGPAQTFTASTVEDMILQVNAQFGFELVSIKDGAIVVNAGDDGNGNLNTISIQDASPPLGIFENLFGIAGGSFTSTGVYDSTKSTYTAGQNAEYTVSENGGTPISVISATNSIDINGTTVDIGSLDMSGGSPVTFTVDVVTDPEDLVDWICDFIDDYNALITTFNNILYENKVDGYAPLTDEQKAEMTEKEIEAWETEAQKGILRNDPTLRSISNSMREVWYSTLDSVGLAAYQIGITTVSLVSSSSDSSSSSMDYSKSGLLSVDREVLAKALEENTSSVRQLFTDSENGIGTKLNSIIHSATYEASYDRGTLVKIAGTEKITGDNTNIIGDKIKSINTVIARLQYRLENEYSRYWKKFSALETAITKMSAQSSWLYEQTA